MKIGGLHVNSNYDFQKGEIRYENAFEKDKALEITN